VPTGLVAGLLLAVVVVVGLATAGPAAAAEDTSRPQARVLMGPSCRPGGMVIEVVARTTAYTVRLATTRRPEGEDEATVSPGASVTLRSGDVAPGETIDSRLEYTALDGSGTSYVDELDDWTFTRPTEADCRAATAAPSTAPGSTAASSSSAAGGAQGPDAQGTDAQGAAVPGQQPTSGQTGPPTVTPAWNEGRATVQSASPSGTFTLAGTGFQPGERVTVHLHGSGVVLGSATAGRDGTVHTAVQLTDRWDPQGAAVDLVGDLSEVTAGVLLAPASLQTPAGSGGDGELWSLLAAAVALVGTVAALVSVAGQQRASTRGSARIRSV